MAGRARGGSNERGGGKAHIRFVLAQINPTVGDVRGNLAKILEWCGRAREGGRKGRSGGGMVVVFPELAVCGYPPEDLLLREDFLAECGGAMEELGGVLGGREWEGVAVVVGHPLQEGGKGGRVFNALSVLLGGGGGGGGGGEEGKGVVQAQYCKRFLPNYGVFDEERYFAAGGEAGVVDLFGVRVGLTICEDIWRDAPVAESVGLGAELVVTINASPFHEGQGVLREEGVVLEKARRFGVPMVYLNQVGGQDELVFDGGSLVVNPPVENEVGGEGEEGKGEGGAEVVVRLPVFEEALGGRRFNKEEGRFVGGGGGGRAGRGGAANSKGKEEDGCEAVYRAMVLGVRDYVEKNGFGGVVLGLSGGVDSALSLAIAADAVGGERVLAVMMPSRYTSDLSLEVARKQARGLGVGYEVIPLQPVYEAAWGEVVPVLEGLGAEEGEEGEVSVAEQNVQARGRGLLLMALSNRLGYLVLTTGNKSELAVGYATLYGDMAGGFAPLKDASKTRVYALARYRNGVEGRAVIPEAVLRRAPSAELAEGQRDVDSLPPYEVLDGILGLLVEGDASVEEVVAAGYERGVVERVVGLVRASEHKRRQAAPGVRITGRGFGRDWRYPITNKFGG